MAGEGDLGNEEPELPRLCNLLSRESGRVVEAADKVFVEAYELIFLVSIFRSVGRSPFCLYDAGDVGEAPARDSLPTDFDDVNSVNFLCEPSGLLIAGVL